ncbi:YhgE/Pip domain-containing protein [Actinomadura bangladeshensis]|uniref:YhgE/Pip domain-containing protein n=1 Tax=Actinomadura bangladeshensis TaxID=453573 RepID=A0A4R4NS41_9ACTN|nr:YhgE/Pip domain-containing protein [Actinomadura bangladeshensis]TDC10032.1 YhgE/Pip domain-containing protein [Actinomadura bangladeshensis]
MRLPALTSGGLELRRFQRNRLTRIALAGLVLLPLLYAGLYLWSFWDPYARLQHVPVALVVQDRPARADGRTVHAGADLADELKQRKIFDWRTVSAEDAEKGVRSGKYYMSLTIPSDFSARIASPSKDGIPTAAGLRLQMNDTNNYVMGTLAQSAFKEISAAAGSEAVRGYFDQIFLSFGELHGELGEAAGGAGRLAEGSGQAQDGAGRLAEGAGEAEAGAGRLKGGIDEARSGSGELTSGLGELHDGTAQVAAGMRRLTATVDRASGTLVPLLRENAPEIRRAALAVAQGADALADGAGRLPARTGAAVEQAEKAQAELETHLAAHPEIPANVRQDLTRAAAQVVAAAKDVDGYVREHAGDLRKVAADARAVEKAARKLAEDAPTLAAKVDKARRDVDRLNAGTQQVNTGAGRLLAGSSRLTGGLGALSDGAGELRGGLGRLSGGAVTLETALAQISDGSGRLAAGLDEGVRQIPDYGDNERAARDDMMSDPVRLASATDNKVPNYGTGFAPFFVPLSLWVGGMIIYMLLRPLNPRAMAGTAPGRRVALAGWLPAALIGAAQACVVLAVLHLALGLRAAHWPGLVAFLALASAAFLAVIQWVNARFGPIGRILALALLMLQLTSAAGTYPIETSPRFFQVIRPYLPMSWVVDGVRPLIGGGSLTPVWQGCAVLVAFLAGGLALTALAVRHNRVWTLKRLHPALKL